MEPDVLLRVAQLHPPLRARQVRALRARRPAAGPRRVVGEGELVQVRDGELRAPGSGLHVGRGWGGGATASGLRGVGVVTAALACAVRQGGGRTSA